MPPSLRSFVDELQKLGAEAATAKGDGKDKRSWAAEHPGAVVGGKLLAANAMFRYGGKLPPVRWLGKEIAGVGARAGMAGKPMINRPMREAAALLIDPQMVSVYEAAHRGGAAAAKHGVKDLGAASDLAELAKKKGFAGAEDAARFVSEIPLESKGGRRVADAILAPKQGIKDTVKRVGAAAKKLLKR